jgi:CTP synthase
MLEEGLDVVALKKLDLPKKAAPDLKIEYFYAE